MDSNIIEEEALDKLPVEMTNMSTAQIGLEKNKNISKGSR